MSDGAPAVHRDPELEGAVGAVLPAVLALRRRVHTWPELGLALPRTQRAVLDALPRGGLTVTTGRALDSVVAVLETGRPGPHVLLRADMDALPLAQAPGDDEPRSRVPGATHACGHDAHTAMLGGVAGVLHRLRHRLRGRVTLAFQPGEEGHGGAGLMIAEGLLDPCPDVALALHTTPTYASGTLATRVGPMCAAADWFTITLRGAAGHAAVRRTGNPVTAAAELCLALERLPLAGDPFEPVLVAVAGLQAGDTHSAVPAEAVLRGTVRSYGDDVAARLRAELVRTSDAVAAARGVRADITWGASYPVTVNDAGCVGTLRAVAARLLGEGAVHDLPRPLTVSEDFGEVAARVPSVLALLGSREPGVADPAPNHSPGLRVHEPALAHGVALVAGWVLEVVAAPD